MPSEEGVSLEDIVFPTLFDASRRGKKTLKYSRDKKNEGMYRSGEGVEGARYVTPNLSYYWEGARE